MIEEERRNAGRCLFKAGTQHNMESSYLLCSLDESSGFFMMPSESSGFRRIHEGSPRPRRILQEAPRFIRNTDTPNETVRIRMDSSEFLALLSISLESAGLTMEHSDFKDPHWLCGNYFVYLHGHPSGDKEVLGGEEPTSHSIDLTIDPTI
eukprot:6964135-Pyramimonas_sp.AAC.1